MSVKDDVTGVGRVDYINGVKQRLEDSAKLIMLLTLNFNVTYCHINVTLFALKQLRAAVKKAL